VDLHSGGFNEELTPHAYYRSGFGEVSEISRQMALCCDMGCLVQGGAGSTLHGCGTERGIPGIVVERGGRGLLLPDEAEAAEADVKSVLRHMGLLCDGALPACFSMPEAETCWYPAAEADGCWYPALHAGDRFGPGTVLGELRDIFGSRLQTVTAERSGMVLYQPASLAVAKGEKLVSCAIFN